MFEILYKLSKNRQVLGIVCKSDKGIIYRVCKSKFRELFNNDTCINAKLALDNKLICTKDSIETLCITNSDRILFHGSKGGLIGSPRSDFSRIKCDFGQGFYTGTKIKQARGILAQSSKGVLYTLFSRTSDLNVYRFSNEVEWALYVGVHRGFIDVNNYPKLKELVFKIDSSDVIVGAIADDRMQAVFPDFMEGIHTDRVLIECLKSVKLGNQWVFKSSKACSSIKIIGVESISNDEKRQIQINQRKVLGSIKDKVSQIQKLYRRSGRFVDEILEGYK